MSPHYETLELVDYARGYLSGEDARELFGHCQGCAYCGNRLAAIMALREGNARERTAIVRRRWVAAAASGVVLIGLVIGLVGAFALTQLMETILFNVSPTDPATYAGVTVFLLAIGLLATYLPARRAARVDPVEALRAD